ncbi:MAG: tetratricopeptide repeat protein [Cyanobacteria bacterium HKST-UBA01]|nr:tetratricopeptide repeat protein [Cyanobacteria bacterium HKST-UBA01]
MFKSPANSIRHQKSQAASLAALLLLGSICSTEPALAQAPVPGSAPVPGQSESHNQISPVDESTVDATPAIPVVPAIPAIPGTPVAPAAPAALPPATVPATQFAPATQTGAFTPATQAAPASAAPVTQAAPAAPVIQTAPVSQMAPVAPTIEIAPAAPAAPVTQTPAISMPDPVSTPAPAPASVPQAPVLSEKQLKELFKEWKKVQDKGQKALDLCEYGKAERTLVKAVELARKLGTDDVQIAKSSGELGRLLTIRGRFSEAEPYLEEELAIKDVALADSDGKIIQDMGDLVKFYLNYGTESKAVPLTDDILDFVEGKIREQRNQSSKAIKLTAGQPLTAWAGMAAPAQRDPLLEWSITCDALGDMYRIRKNYDIADRLFKAALDVKATVLGKKHLSLANSYDNLATICMEKNDFKEAESYYRDALRITEKILEPGDPQIYSRITKLARCLMKENKWDEAEKLYQRANQMFANSDSIYKQHALFALGCLYSDRKRYSSAAPVLARALRLAEKNHGICSENLGPYLRKYAYVLYYLGQRGQTDSLRARANSVAPIAKALTPKVKMGKLEAKVN